MEDLKEVDWGKAPEGATHYNEDCACPWLKETPPSYFYDGDWVEYTPNQPNNIERHFSDAVKRPQEWDGSGIPPVGTVCEYRLNEGGTWFTCKITYVLSGTDDCFLAWCDHLDLEQFLTFSSDKYKLQLRNIKTPEQIAAEEERLHVIGEMLDLVEDYSTFKDVMGKLYDAGYRKTEAG